MPSKNRNPPCKIVPQKSRSNPSLKRFRVGRQVLLELLGHGLQPVERLFPARQVLLVQLVAVADPAVPGGGGAVVFPAAAAAFSPQSTPFFEAGSVLTQDIAEVDEFLLKSGEFAQRILVEDKVNAC